MNQELRKVDFGLTYTLNNQFMGKPGKELACGKESLEIKFSLL